MADRAEAQSRRVAAQQRVYLPGHQHRLHRQAQRALLARADRVDVRARARALGPQNGARCRPARVDEETGSGSRTAGAGTPQGARSCDAATCPGTNTGSAPSAWGGANKTTVVPTPGAQGGTARRRRLQAQMPLRKLPIPWQRPTIPPPMPLTARRLPARRLTQPRQHPRTSVPLASASPPTINGGRSSPRRSDRAPIVAPSIRRDVNRQRRKSQKHEPSVLLQT